MKSHTSEFKEEIKILGKQQSVRITYKENNVTKTLTNEDINSVTPNYEASLLKSVMKVLELDSNVSIPKGTEIKFEYGLLVNGAYEYLNYGNYIVAKEPEKQEDTLSYKITCYDKMLYSMKDYEHIEVNYPCKIKKFLIELCKKIGLEFKDSTFANQDREFANELFMTINEDGTYSSMGYTYRDVLDQIAETTGGCICMTLDDEVEVRYINKAINYATSKKSTNIEFESSVKENVKIKELDGKSTQETRDGKNKFNLDYIRQPFSNFKITDTGVNITKCWIADLYTSENVIKTFKPNTTYTMKVKAKVVSRPSTMVSSQNALFALYRATSGNLPSVWRECISMPDKGTIALNKEKEYITTFTTPADMTNVRFLTYTFYGNNDGSTTGTAQGEIDVSEIMLVEGTYTSETFPEFELYGVSPTPKYPSSIRNVGDNINIFDKSNANKLSAYFWSGSTIQTLNTRRIIYVPCKPNTMYSVSKKAGKKFILSTTKVTPALGVQTFGFVQGDTASLLSLKTPPDARYLLVQYFDTSVDTLTEQEILDSIKIEEGTGTPYSPYNCGNINIFKSNRNLANMDLLYQEMQSFNATNLSQKIVDGRNCIAFSNNNYQNVYGFKGLPNRYRENTRYKFSFYARLQDTSDTAKNYSLFLQTFDKSGKLINNVRCPNATEWTKFELITPENTSLYYFDFSYSSPAMWLIDKDTFMIEEYKEGKNSNYIKNQEQNIVFPLNEGQRLCKNSYLAEDGIHLNRMRIVLNGTENWDIRSDTHEMRLNLSSYNAIYGSKILCDKLVQATSYNGTGNKIRWILNSQIICICSEELNTANMTLDEWKQYLSENNLIIEIGITEKIEPYTSRQKEVINSIVTEKGTNIFKFESNAILNYPVNYDTINEEYINDTNVNFGEKYRAN